LAARTHTDQAVGLNSAALSAMFFIVNVAQLNLVHALTRYLPTAGQASFRLVLRLYLLTAALALAAGTVFVLGASLWAPSLRELGSGSGAAVWFVLSCGIWCLFSLQDGVLAGLGQSRWVLLSTTTYAVVKLGLLAVIALSFPLTGIFISWVVPALLVLIPMTWLIFKRLIPAHVRATAATDTAPVSTRDLIRFVLANHLSALIWMGSFTLLPIIVVERVGAASGAYFFLAWSIGSMLFAVSSNMGMALVVEGAKDAERLARYSYESLAQTMRLLLPAVLVVCLAAPLLLRLFGNGYAAEGTTLLRLLSLSALPYAVISNLISVLRVRNDIWLLLGTYLALCAVVLTGSLLTLPSYGITGIGWSWLLGLSAIASVVLAVGLRIGWLPVLQVPAGVMSILHGPRVLNRHAEVSRARLLLPEAVSALAQAGQQVQPEQYPAAQPAAQDAWHVVAAISSNSDLQVTVVAAANSGLEAVLKVPRTPGAQASVQRNVEVLRTLRSDYRLAGTSFQALMPAVLGEVWIPQFCVVEQKLPGNTLARLFRNGRRDPLRRTAAGRAAEDAQHRSWLLQAAAPIRELHDCTGFLAAVTEQDLAGWVEAPVESLISLTGTRQRSTYLRKRIEALRQELRAGLLGQPVVTGWVHGDYSPQNLLATDPESGLTGIVDWEMAADGQPVALDLTYLYLSARMLRTGSELGVIVCGELEAANGTSPLACFLREAGIDADTRPPVRPLLFLTWLHHVHHNGFKSAGALGHRFWITQNVTRVLVNAVGR
jgi:O-antigen/teichoic acid export membrane protein/thiamine kinase-like enzyme